MGGPPRCSPALRGYGARARPAHRRPRARVQPFPWIDIPLVRRSSPADDLLPREGRGARACPGSARYPAALGIVRRAPRRVRPRRRAPDARGRRATAARSASSSRARASARACPGPAQPGAAMVALQEDVPVVPRRHPRHADVAAGQLRARLDRVGRADALRRRCRGREGLPARRRPRSSGELRRLFDWLADCTSARPAARRRAAAVSVTTSRSRCRARRGERRLLGTVAIVGFPNVGKSTLVNRLTGTRAAVVHETPGVTRDRKELVCEWNGKRFLLDRHGRRRHRRRRRRSRARSPSRRARRSPRPTSSCSSSTPGSGSRPATRRSPQILREARKPVLVLANKIDDPRQEPLALEFHRLGLGDPLPLSGAARPRHRRPARRDRRAPRGARRRAAAPSCREEAIRVAILGRPNVGKSSLLNALLGARARDRLGGPRHDARRDRHRARARRPHVRRSSTPPACAASAATGRGSSTTRSCARSRRRSAPTSRSCSSTPREGDRRPGPRRRGRGAQGALLDARRALQVGRRPR